MKQFILWKIKIFTWKSRILGFFELSEYYPQLAHIAMTVSIWAAIPIKQGFCSPICQSSLCLLHRAGNFGNCPAVKHFHVIYRENEAQRHQTTSPESQHRGMAQEELESGSPDTQLKGALSTLPPSISWASFLAEHLLSQTQPRNTCWEGARIPRQALEHPSQAITRTAVCVQFHRGTR